MRVALVEVAQHAGEEGAERVVEEARVGEKHTRVPVELATLHKHAGKFAVGLLCERLHAVDLVAGHFAFLDIAVAWLRTGGLDAHREQTVVGAYEIEALAYVGEELLLVQHHLVGGDGQQAGILVGMIDAVARPRHAGCRVAVYGFGQDMVVVHLGQLFVHQVEVGRIGVDVYVVQRQHPPHAVKGLL